MTTNHTSGPWKTDVTLQDERDKIFFHTDVNANGIRVAIAGGVGPEVSQANARLIAAAPQMLEALQAFMELFEDSDMRPEDESHELAFKIRNVINSAI